jgi:DMSO reductase anchor subunit
LKKLLIIDPVRQRIWQWPAVVNLICGGTACGFYLLKMIADTDAGTGSASVYSTVADLTAPLLVLLGFAAVATEAGRPLAGIYSLHHLRTSWMSREVLAGSALILFSAVAAYFPQPVFKIPAALGAGGLLLSQAMMVNRCKAVTAWDRPMTTHHFLLSGCYMGFGLLLMLQGSGGVALNPLLQWIGLFAGIATLRLWYRFVFSTSSGPQGRALEPLQAAMPLTVTIGIGHLIPLAMLLIFILSVSFNAEFKALGTLHTMAGIAILLGGSAQKYYIILVANVLRQVNFEQCSEQPIP